MKVISFIINFIDIILWIIIKFTSSRVTFKLINLSKKKLLKLNIKNKEKFKKTIKIIIYADNNLFFSKFSSCLSRTIAARFFYNLIGLESNLKLGMILKKNEKIPHAWLEEKYTGEKLTIKSLGNDISSFKLNL